MAGEALVREDRQDLSPEVRLGGSHLRIDAGGRHRGQGQEEREARDGFVGPADHGSQVSGEAPESGTSRPEGQSRPGTHAGGAGITLRRPRGVTAPRT